MHTQLLRNKSMTLDIIAPNLELDISWKDLTNRDTRVVSRYWSIKYLKIEKFLNHVIQLSIYMKQNQTCYLMMFM